MPIPQGVLTRWLLHYDSMIRDAYKIQDYTYRSLGLTKPWWSWAQIQRTSITYLIIDITHVTNGKRVIFSSKQSTHKFPEAQSLITATSAPLLITATPAPSTFWPLECQILTRSKTLMTTSKTCMALKIVIIFNMFKTSNLNYKMQFDISIQTFE